MGLLDLFIAASIPVLKVLLVTGLGSFLALDNINLLGEDARKHMNNIVFFVFSPSLIGANLAKTITYESMAKLWFMPVNVLITFIIGSALGWVIIQLTRPPPHIRGLVIGCCAAGNLGNLMVIIIPAICKEKGSPFGAPEFCQSYGMSYASLSMALGAVYLWLYVYNIVRVSSRASANEVVNIDSSVSKPSSESLISKPENCTEPLLSKDSEDQLVALPCTRFDAQYQMSIVGKIKKHAGDLLGMINFKRIFAPSTIGAIIGFTVGLVPLFKRSIIGDEAPLRVIQDSAMLLADGAIPVLTLIIGGNLLKGLRGSIVDKSVIVCIVIARYVALPLMGIATVKLACRFGLVPSSDPLYQFVLLLQFAMPPAMNIGTITQLFGAGEAECSVIMLWTYALASISLTVWSTIFMWLVA